MRERLGAELLDLLLDPGRRAHRAAAETSLEEVRVVARQAGVGRAQEREQVTSLAVEPRVAKQRQERLAERRLPQLRTPFERVRDPERRERGVERRAPAVERGTDDADLLGRRSGPQQAEDLLGEELERAAQARAFQESERAVERRGFAGRLSEQRALQVREDRPARRRVRRELLAVFREGVQVVRSARERGERVASRLVRQRNGDFRAGGQRLEERPFGAGQVLEAVREDGPAVPGVQLARDALRGVPALELAVPEAEPVELVAVGLVQLGELALELTRLGQAGLELRDRLAERIGKPGEARRAPEHPATRPSDTCDHPPKEQRALRLGDHRPVRAVAASEPLEEVVEGPDRAADESACVEQELPLGPVDVRPVGHDQDRIEIERAQIALEQKRDFAGVGRACKQAETHRPHPSVGARQPLGAFLPSSDRCCGLRPSPSPGGCLPRHLACTVVAEIGLLRAAARVREVEPHRRAFSFFDFPAAVVTDEHCLACQVDPSSLRCDYEDPFVDWCEYYAALRALRIRCERSRLNSACSSRSRPTSRAPTTRKCRGRKSSIVLPSRYWSMTAGLTYDARATAGVFPSFSPTARMTPAMARFDSVSDSTTPRSASAIAATSVPPHVRKSLAVNSSPICSRMYWFTPAPVRLQSASPSPLR